jgi:hypothetical protein
LCATTSLPAQSAADKATARKLATEGIQLYQEGKYTEALDKVSRAEALYDAPVHLLYIARAQAKLNKLIDAAETYRRLVRVTLEPGAPPAFKEAIESGRKELEVLEPTLPALRIDVEPANVAGLELSVAGEKVSAASVGVERPMNPGRTVIIASAPGYKPAQVEVDVKPSSREAVRLVLVADPNAAVATPPPAPLGPTPPTPITEPPPSTEQSTKGVGFFVGLRLAAAIPAGELYKDGGDMSDVFKVGAGAELHGGIRFLRFFGAKLFAEGYVLKPGAALDEVTNYTAQVDVSNTTSATGFGVSVLGGLLDRGKFGAFGELGFVSQNFYVTRTFTDSDASGLPVCGESEDTIDISGSAFRIGGGANIPIGRLMHLTPFVMAEFGSFSNLEAKIGCAERANFNGVAQEAEAKIPSSQRAGHQLFLIGIGGDFIFGKGP